MAWSIVSVQDPVADGRVGWYEVGIIVTDGVETRRVFAHFDHLPTNQDKTDARNQVIAQLSAVAPAEPPRPIEIRRAIRAILNGAGTAAQKATAIDAYITNNIPTGPVFNNGE